MKRTLVRETPQFKGQTVRLRGWINTTRALGKVNFIILRDRTGLVQVVVDKEEYAKVKDMHPGAVLDILGQVQETPQTELGIEIVNPKILLESPVREAPPVEYYKPKIEADIDVVLDNRVVSLRNQEIQAVFRIQGEIAHAYRLFMHDVIGAYEYFGPNMIGASSEGGAEFFNVDYFGYSATLAQSSQIYKQMMVGVNERVFAIMPFFRAENSNTVRHLTEGKQLEFEMGFFDSWQEVMDVEENLMKFVIKHLHKNCASELKAFNGDILKAPEDVRFPRLTFFDALELYYKRTGIDERREKDLSPAAEKELCRWAVEEYGCDFVFVTDWLTSKRPFYSYPNPENPQLSNTFDLLAGGLEITSGGQRRHTYESMLEGITSRGMNPDSFTDYLSTFKYGMPPHGGFGVGLERLTMTILKLKNIREASLFPSDPRRIAGNRIKAKIFTGAENVRNEIIRQLKDIGAEYKHLEHVPTPTSEDSARVRATKLEEGVKSIIVVGKQTKKNYQFNVPSNMKVDMKLIAQLVGERCEFEEPENIKARFGIVVGGVPPFGNLFNLETYFDERLQKNEVAAFNCGMQTESIVMKAQDLISLVKPKIANFAKD